MQPFDKLPYMTWQDDAGHTNVLRPNVQVEESITLDSDITEHPVETGSDITDHIRSKPDMVEVEWFFSDAVTRSDVLDPHPDIEQVELKAQDPAGLTLASLTSTSNLLTGAINLLTPKVKYFASFYVPPDKPRYVDAYDKLQELRNNATLVSIKTTTALFDEMAIESVSISRTNGEGNGAKIGIRLKHVRFVQSDITLAVPLPKDARAQPKKDAVTGGPCGPPPPPNNGVAWQATHPGQTPGPGFVYGAR